MLLIEATYLLTYLCVWWDIKPSSTSTSEFAASKIDPTPRLTEYGLALAPTAFAAWQVDISHPGDAASH